MNDEQMRLSKDIMADGFGLIAAAGYINNEGGQAIADAATELIDGGCGRCEDRPPRLRPGLIPVLLDANLLLLAFLRVLPAANSCY